MLPNFNSILFDFDGTLAVLNLDFALMRQRVLALAVAQGLASETLQEMYILEMIDHATALLQQQQPALAHRFEHDAEQLLRDMELEAAQSSTLLPGIQELLDTLRRQRIGVGIVTRNCNAAVRRMFPELDTYCQAFVPRDQVEQVKPHPAHLQTALERLGSSPDRTIMVGDGIMDIAAGKALGMFTVGVLSGTGTRERLLAQGANLILDSASDLLPRLTAGRSAW